ncbi:MAG: radical SAM protein, partial [Planctomycetota bacterium]
MSCSCRQMADGFAFAPEDISAAVDRCGLLSMEIEFSRLCNYRCPYCYNDEVAEEEPLKSGEIDDIILQAKGLGAQKIIILGGEPMIHPRILEKIRFIREHDMAVEMFTNGTN